MLIRKYTNEDYGKVISFLQANWALTHALYDKRIFDWQYLVAQKQQQGINHASEQESLVILKEDKIVGFLGIIPNQYIWNGQALNGAALTMWVIDEKLRNSGLGILLIRETEKNNEVTLTLGCNPAIVPLYKKMGYSYLERLNRYVMPLDPEGYLKLLSADVAPEAIQGWQRSIEKTFGSRDDANLHIAARTEQINLHELESLYRESIGRSLVFSRNRDADFWEWRYLNSPGYRYFFFGNPQAEGIVVARVERIINNENSEMDGRKVLRIIECIPKCTDVWNGHTDPLFTNLIRKVCMWGKHQGCVAADFQISTGRLESTLFEAGFRKQEADYLPDICSLAGLFQPFRYRVTPINFVWKVKQSGKEPIQIDPNDTYFVKSDCDMDRPNIWPLAEDWR
ncbi:GNAT family N-acetyltransferase [Fodinisporobacter ferrooxydans]|uniref:GNAT family N-acetyltransferase n=1 Tax=Fodinisporobacter ferrooxydans TaxID=2901836 RepID=A0ABY4CQB3_9BACL|nr:GNAT family N-acetyltransferase [Alicyclobacillaceae bacterium MYW30-H2]